MKPILTLFLIACTLTVATQKNHKIGGAGTIEDVISLRNAIENRKKVSVKKTGDPWLDSLLKGWSNFSDQTLENVIETLDPAKDGKKWDATPARPDLTMPRSSQSEK